MEDVKLKLNEKGEGAFYIMDGGEQIGEMEVGIKGNMLTVYHTEVAEKAEGKGLSKVLLTAMAEYARKNKFKVQPYCSFVHLQFQKHADEYADIWQK